MTVDPAQTADQPPDEPADEPARERRRWSTRRRVLIGVGVLVLLVLAGAAWVLYTGLQARTELEAVRAAVHKLRSDVSAGDLSAARADADSVRAHSDRAYDLTTGPIWAVAAAIPYVGDPLDTTRAVTSSVHSIADGALPAVIDATDRLTADRLRGADGRFDVAAISALGPPLDHAATVMDAAVHTISAASDTTWLGSVNRARDDLLGQLTHLTASVHLASLAVDVVPPMLGADGPRVYMIAFENDAQVRGIGGLPGAFAILRADHGKLSFTRFAKDGVMTGVHTDLSFGPGFDKLWPGAPTKVYQNSADSPHFPYAAQIWTAMWQRRSGERLDGVIALDPTALADLLAVTGSATLPDHTTVGASNVVSLTQRDVYRQFATDNRARGLYLLVIARAIAHKLLTTDASLTTLLRAAGHAAGEQRLLVWANDPAIESRLSPLPLAGVVPTTSPYAGVAFVNTLGSKLDYYLHSSFSYRRSGCGSTRAVTATITLTNDATPGLPRKVYGFVNHPGYPHGLGTNRLAVYYFASAGAKFTSITNGGTAIQPYIGSERGHPVVKVSLTIPAGQSRTLELHFTEPAGTGAPIVRVTPLINPMSVDVADADCGS